MSRCHIGSIPIGQFPDGAGLGRQRGLFPVDAVLRSEHRVAGDRDIATASPDHVSLSLCTRRPLRPLVAIQRGEDFPGARSRRETMGAVGDSHKAPRYFPLGEFIRVLDQQR